jgi:hypothetical protein
MDDNRQLIENEDNRNTLRSIANLFENNAAKRDLKDSKFEEVIKQIVYRKSAYYYDLFLVAYDEICNYTFNNYEEFERHIEKQRKNKYPSRLLKFYESSNNEEPRDDTIKYALEVYNYQTVMLDKLKFSSLRRNTNDNNGFDNILGLLNSDNVLFDIFLSHRYIYKFYNLVIYYALTVYYGFTVYVDWIYDKEIDRKDVTRATCDMLIKRMRQSKTFIFFNINKLNTTNWMSWEVGYFRGFKADAISILDLNGYCKGNTNVEVMSTEYQMTYHKSSNDIIVNGDSAHSIKDWVKKRR